MVRRDTCCQINPIFKQFLSKRIQIAMVLVRSNDGRPRKVIVVGFYCNPEHRKKKESLQELDLLMSNLC